MTSEMRQVQYAGKEFSAATKYSRVSGNWLIFLHGLGCAKECFDQAFDTELATQYSILTLDFVGFGASDKPDEFSYTLEDQAKITEQVIGQFNPRKIVLVAHSMGGTIGVLLARELPHLANFINVEGNLVSEDAGIISRRTAQQTESGFINEGFNIFLSGLQASDEPSFRTWAHWYEQSSRIAIYRSGGSLVRWSDSGQLLPLFNNLPKKAYVYGDKADNDFLLKQLKDVDVLPIPNSGHFMMLDNPESFYASIAKHIE